MDIEIDILSGTVEVKAPDAVTPAPASSAQAPTLVPGPGLLADIPDLILPTPGGLPEPDAPVFAAPASAAFRPSVVAEPEPAPVVPEPVVARPEPPPAMVAPVAAPAISQPAPFVPSVSEPVRAAAPAGALGLIEEIRARWQKNRVIDDEVLGTFHLGGTLAAQHALLRECLLLLARAPEEAAERGAKELARLTGMPPLWIWAEAQRIR